MGDVEIVSQFYDDSIANGSFEEHIFDILSDYFPTDKIRTAWKLASCAFEDATGKLPGHVADETKEDEEDA